MRDESFSVSSSNGTGKTILTLFFAAASFSAFSLSSFSPIVFRIVLLGRKDELIEEIDHARLMHNQNSYEARLAGGGKWIE